MPQSIPELLTTAATRYGAHPALVMDDSVLTYAGLEEAANRMARSLIRYGVQPGDRVALWLPKSIEAIVSVWGVMKAGAAYVPVDSAAPVARLATLARDCEVAGLVTMSDRAETLQHAFAQSGPMRAIWYADRIGDAPGVADLPVVTWSELQSESAAQPSLSISSEDLAVVHYTSGSTGTPKGVMLPHRALLGQARWTREIFGLSADDRIAGYTPIHSAMSTFDILASACAGAATYPVPPRLAAFPAAVARSWSEQRLTVWFVVPSVLIMILKRADLGALDLSSLRLVGFGGETLPLEPLRELMRLLPWVRFVHQYGRTEVKIRSYHEVKFPAQEADTRRIGKTPSDLELFVLDEDARPVRHGAVGELWVSGPSLMRGYWGLPELTAETLRTIDAGEGRRVLACRTGDLVKQCENGGFELLGRADQQIKIRGYRVEAGEVENALLSHPAVEWAVVGAVSDGSIGNRLKAVVVLKDGAQADEQALGRHCAAILPPHMLPQTIEFRSSLPLNPNGKVDRRALMGAAKTHEI